MKRRNALKSLGLAIGSTLALPAWASNWNKASFENYILESDEILAALVENIIPETDTPGAKSIGAHLYIERMIRDCYDKKEQDFFAENLKNLNNKANTTLGKDFHELSLERRSSLLSDMNSNDEKAFMNMIKRLTIRAYTNSEYYLTTQRNYTMAPGFFHGCVNI